MERINVMICAGTGCTSSNSAFVDKNFLEVLQEYGIDIWLLVKLLLA